jgi:hypothetical protein
MNSRMRLPLSRAIVVAAVVIVALAGCVGIPSSGGVNIGGAISDKGKAVAPADLPLPPRKGESKQALLSDFMQAATSPDNGYYIAKQFLTKSAAQRWNPTKSVLIRQGTPSARTQPDGSIDYMVTTRASVDASGVYTPQSTTSTQLLSFSFRKVAGEWRISTLADGTVISGTSFAGVFSPQTLYFFDPTFHFLVPDLRWFPTGAAAPSRIVSALLAGPAPWLQGGSVASGFPRNVQLASGVVVRASSAVVDLSAGAQATKPIDRAHMLQQLQESLSTAGVTGVVTMTVRGAPLPSTDSTSSNAIPALAVDSAPLVGDGKKFGVAPRMQAIGKLSAQIVNLGASAVSLDRAQSSAAVRAPGGVYLVSDSADKPLLVDNRPSLIPPSIDPFGYVWSAPFSNATAIRATTTDGVPHEVASAIPTNSRIVALAVSHDGTRVLMYLDTPAGPRLDVAGVLRHGTDNVPISLGPLLDLPVSTATPIDATWVDDRSVAALAETSSSDSVTTFTIGGAADEPTLLTDGARIVGGSTVDGLRVLTTTGQVQQLRSSGWQNTGTTASILATQQ